MISNVISSILSQGKVIAGGTLSSDATYFYRAFTASGTLEVSGGTISCDVLVIAGGGGGGGGVGGGGGAGGYQLFTAQTS